ncbi:MAG: lamin tail domain-containing protein [Akkermansiaceae bacterium]
MQRHQKILSAILCMTVSSTDAAAPPVDSVVVFNELHYNPADASEAGEFVELHNQMGIDIDLSDWELTGGVNYTFADGTIIPGGGYLVIARSPALIPSSLGPYIGALGNSGETIRLRDKNRRLMDELSYRDSGDWPVSPDGSGVSLSKKNQDSSSPFAKNWTSSLQIGGTPGGDNFPPPVPSVTGRVIEFYSEWKYNNSDNHPGADWADVGYNDNQIDWKTGTAAFDFGSPTIYSNEKPIGGGNTTPPVFRTKIDEFHPTGVDDNGNLIPPGNRDPHYRHTADGLGAFIESAHPAWLGPDGESQWLGPTANGTDSTAPGSVTYQLEVDLTHWRPQTAEVLFSPSVDNTLNALRVNGTTINGINGSGFRSYLGPFLIQNTNLIQGLNTIEFDWTNAGSSPNPAGFRAKWAATAEPILSRTVLPKNPQVAWFRKSFDWGGDPESSYQLNLEYLVDAGAVFYLNGTEVLRYNVPVVEDVRYPQFSGATIIPANAFVPGTNVLAVELHQPRPDDLDAIFGMTLDVTETPPSLHRSPDLRFEEIAGASSATDAFFVELKNSDRENLMLEGYRIRDSNGQEFVIGGDVSLASGSLLSLDEDTLGFRPAKDDKIFLIAPGESSIIDGAVVRTRTHARDDNGLWQVPSTPTPGLANSFAIPNSIVINEIMYNKMPTHLPTGVIANDEEWVELYNRSGNEVVLTGWKLRGGADFDFPDGASITAGGYLLVAADPSTLSQPALGPWSGGLSNSGDIVRIEDANDNTVDEVIFADGGRWDNRADGGGSSLELRHPDMDTSSSEAWAASDETGKAAWQTFSYPGQASPPTGSNDPTTYNEFILGLLNDGEVLIDNVSVINKSTGNTQLIQNQTFDSNADTWRLRGNHGLHGESRAVDGALRIVSTGATEHMHNHCETTLKNGNSFVTINSGHNYTISFRAKWQSGSPRLHSRLYFNRLARQHLLDVPTNNGTPGAANSRLLPEAAPVILDLSHSPVIPAAGESVTVSAKGATMLHWRLDSSSTWNDVPMTGGEAKIPGQGADSLVQFYVSAGLTDFPAAGTDSRAMIQWANGIVPTGPGHGFRILLPKADADEMHTITQVMSNWYRPCTVVYREREVFYHAKVRLRSSQRGRNGTTRAGFAIQFDPTEKFRGVHEVVNMDRSAYGPGTTDNGSGQVDIINQQVAYRAGGIPAMYNDMVYLIAPRSIHNGSAQMTMAEFNDVYLDSQWSNGADSPTFKMDLIYYPTTTSSGTPEGLKNANPDLVNGVQLGQLTGLSKEDYRWHFLIGNARAKDDYTRLIAFNHAINRLSAGDPSELEDTIDINQWLRASALMSLVNSNDSYSTGGLPHNQKFFVRPDDGRMLYLPWDADFRKRPTDYAVVGNNDLARMLNSNPVWRRIFYGHLHDIIATSYNTTYLSDWVRHLSDYSTAPGNWNEILTYVQDRSNHVLSECASIYPNVNFAITTNNGNDFSIPVTFTTVNGNAWINVSEIYMQGNPLPLGVTWTGSSTWSAQLPVSNGTNTFTLEARNYQGEIIASDSITITGTGNIDTANASNLVISEFDYNPAAPSDTEMNAGFINNNDFEFIELQNISGNTIDLSSCRFENGIEYTFDNGTLLAARERLVIPRRSEAFSQRYPEIPTTKEYIIGEENSLRNSGEEIALVAAGGQDIKRFTYNDKPPWPTSADGNGSSLVLIAPTSNPDHRNPFNWRASTTPNPATNDSLPAPSNPSDDELFSYASGSSSPALSFKSGSVTFLRETRADANFNIETSPDLINWQPAVERERSRTSAGGSIESITQRIQIPPASEKFFVRIRVSLPPTSSK